MHAFTANQRARSISRYLSKLLDRFQLSETAVLLITALIVGIVTGLASVLMIKMVQGIAWFGYTFLPGLIPELGRVWLIIIPVLGALIAGPFVITRFPEIRASGIPAVMESLALHGGRIKGRIGIVKLIFTSITLGSGGSAGREGPIVQIGSSVGSTLGQLLRLSEYRTRNLVACGAAAGISAAFNAPIAGVAFALEELGGELGLSMLGNVVIAAVAAAVVSHGLLGAGDSLIIPIYRLGDPSTLLFYVILGVLTGLWGVIYIKVFYRTSDFFTRWTRTPAWTKPALGALLLGLIGFTYPAILVRLGLPPEVAGYGLPVADYLPQIYGAGFDVIEASLRTPLPILLVGTLLGLKLIGTSLTLGSGMSGGMFAPSLFMGAMLGSLFGQMVELVYPANTINASAFALAGMAGVLTGAVRAPLTSMLIVFELSNDYAFILPLMATTIVSAIVAHRLHPESMYSLQLSRKGIRLQHGRDVDVLDAVLVQEVMGSIPDTLPETGTLEEVHHFFESTHHHGALVLNDDNELVGVVTLQDLHRVDQLKPVRQEIAVREIMTRTLLVVYPDESIGVALQRMAARDVGRLPVVERRNPKRLIGIIRRSDIVRAYRHGIIHRDDLQDRANQIRISRREGGTEFVELTVRPGAVVASQKVRDIELPSECLLTTRRHGDHMHLLHGDDILEPGDVILALCEPNQVDALQNLFT